MTDKAEQKKAALKKIAKFREQVSRSAWRLDRDAVFARLATLVGNPSLVDQNGLNLCGPAAFLRVWLENDPCAVVDFACKLYEDGKASIGKLSVEPDEDSLFDEDYDQIKRDYEDAHKEHGCVFTPQAEWMILGSIRDAFNTWTDFDGTPEEGYDAMTLPGEVAEWLEATGQYESVENEGNFFFTKGLEHAQGLKPGDSTDILLLINAHILSEMQVPTGNKKSDGFLSSAFPNHFVVLTKPIEITQDGKVKISVWSWGAVYEGTISKETFEANYYGAVTGTKTKD